MAQDKNGHPASWPQQDKNGRPASGPGLLNDLSSEGGRLHFTSFAPSCSTAQGSSSSSSSGEDESLEGEGSGWVEWLLEGFEDKVGLTVCDRYPNRVLCLKVGEATCFCVTE